MPDRPSGIQWTLTVDRDRCELSGYCTHTAPRLVTISDSDELQIRHEALSPSEIDEARGAVAACPFKALKVQERVASFES